MTDAKLLQEPAKDENEDVAAVAINDVEKAVSDDDSLDSDDSDYEIKKRAREGKTK